MSTFKYLQEEQAVDTSRFQRIRELYKEITLENTLKLLLRCKIAYDNRRRLLAVFLCHGEWERQCGKLQKLMESSCNFPVIITDCCRSFLRLSHGYSGALWPC